MGINTVELKGEPFDVAVTANQTVTHGQLLATADLAAIKTAGKQTTMLTVITNMDRVAGLKFNQPSGQVESDILVLRATTN